MRVVSHIPDFGDVPTSLYGDLASSARDAVFLVGMCISKRDDVSPVADDRISRVWVPRLPREMWDLHR